MDRLYEFSTQSNRKRRLTSENPRRSEEVRTIKGMMHVTTPRGDQLVKRLQIIFLITVTAKISPFDTALAMMPPCRSYEIQP